MTDSPGHLLLLRWSEHRPDQRMYRAVDRGGFAKLFESFPMPADLEYHDYTKMIVPDPIETPEGERQLVEGTEFFRASINWLVASGYIVQGNQNLNSNTIRECVLTAKALAVLKATPDS
ncbi:hypothetical protein [Pseudomonas typographi]|uniref:hypothetical protein n=1 Tax=Pseudomonas typographi TaxID=2715964 RepID=UPI001688C534|nr:hypothetical protein [Pseudomonas typographi]MBD1586700.1 hypothetical protein [Pseudomonas typographi]